MDYVAISVFTVVHLVQESIQHIAVCRGMELALKQAAKTSLRILVE